MNKTGAEKTSIKNDGRGLVDFSASQATEISQKIVSSDLLSTAKIIIVHDKKGCPHMLPCINATVMTNESPETVIEEFQTRMDQAGLSKLVEVVLNPMNGDISLDRIRSWEPGNGYADEALQILVSLCDYYHKSIELHPYPLDDKTCKERLVGWYARHGFIGVASYNSVMRRNHLGAAIPLVQA